jgi:hypothetical protein
MEMIEIVDRKLIAKWVSGNGLKDCSATYHYSLPDSQGPGFAVKESEYEYERSKQNNGPTIASAHPT